MEALGRVELPTNGLGNMGFHPHPNRLSHLQGGLRRRERDKSPHSAIIWQRKWQRLARAHWKHSFSGGSFGKHEGTIQ